VTAAPAPDAPPSLAWPRGSLIVCGVAYLLLALAGGPLIGGSLWFDPDGNNELEVVAMLGVAALWFVVSGAVAAANFVLASASAPAPSAGPSPGSCPASTFEPTPSSCRPTRSTSWSSPQPTSWSSAETSTSLSSPRTARAASAR
jgi:hypothetical protein